MYSVKLRAFSIIMLFLFSSMFFSTINAKASTTNIVETDFNAQFSPLVGNPDDAFNMFNETGRENAYTGYNSWEEDWGVGEVPQGVYYGSGFAPAILDTGIQRTYERCFFEVGFTVNLSAEVVMNGASGFWLKAPIVYDSNLFYKASYRLHPYNNSFYQVFIDDDLVFSPNSIVIGSSLYIHIEYVIFPDNEYSFILRFPFDYWGVFSIPERGFYNSTLRPQVLVTSENLYFNGSSHFGFLVTDKSRESVGFNYSHYLLNSSYGDYTSVVLYEFSSNLSLGYSFIFTNGIGVGGLFGKSYLLPSFDSMDSVVVFTTVIQHNNVSNNNVSLIIPFYSLFPVFVVAVSIEIPVEYGNFGAGGTYFMEYVVNNYSNIFIYTFHSHTLSMNASAPSNVIPVRIYFYIKSSTVYNDKITFLTSVEKNVEVVWYDLFTTNFHNIVYAFRWVNFFYNGGFDGYLDRDTLFSVSFSFFKLVCFAETTSGQWAWIWHNSTGHLQYDYVFRTKIIVPVTFYTLTNGLTGEVVYVGTNGTVFSEMLIEIENIVIDSGDDDEYWLYELYGAIKQGIMGVYDGQKRMYGYIVDGLQALGDAIVQIGVLIKTFFIKFWGVLESIMIFVEENIVSILELLINFASAFIFLLVMPTICKSFKGLFVYVGGRY